MKIEAVIDEVWGYLVEVGFPYEYDAKERIIKHVFKIECDLGQALVVFSPRRMFRLRPMSGRSWSRTARMAHMSSSSRHKEVHSAFADS